MAMCALSSCMPVNPQHQASEHLHINELLCQWVSTGLLPLGFNLCQAAFDALTQPLLRVCRSPAGHTACSTEHPAWHLSTTLQRALLEMGAGRKCSMYDS